MTALVTWYDVVGVVPDASTDDIREAWQERKAVLEPGLMAGVSPEVLSAAGLARHALDEAWRVLADPATRESYDEQIGFARPGEGLAPPWRGPLGPDVGLGEGWSTADAEALEPYPERPSRVLVPRVCGLFYAACMDVAGRVGLHVEPIRLTSHPMPVEGLVVGQAPAAGDWVRRDSRLTVQVWHPSERGGEQPVVSG